jgi:putative heme-binding domain-containing protein
MVLSAALLLAIGLIWRMAERRSANASIVRVPWTTSRVTGTPEPPPPYDVQRVYPKLSFKNPVDIAFASGTGRAFVVEQYGKIFSFPYDTKADKADLLVDLAELEKPEMARLPNCAGYDSTYGLTFHPNFQKNHYCYICYTFKFNLPEGTPRTKNTNHGTRVSRFTVSQTDPPTIDTKSERILLSWFAGGHNGGCIKFGPDGYLYISSGDGADPDPPDLYNTGQDISDLMSSVLRIDVDHAGNGKPYSIPSDNPFVHTPGAAPEVWCYGLRNPWRMSFDSKTGNLWIGDVGWELWESIHCGKPGANFGWSIMEGPNPVRPNDAPGPTPITPPQIALNHSEAASLTGGIVYRGKKLPGLEGYYVFGDWAVRRLWAAKCEGDKVEPHREFALTDQRIVAFGEDFDHEMVYLDHEGGGLWQLVPNPAAYEPSTFPRKLSESGLFTSTKDQAPAPGVAPFAINAPQWVDGATGEHWIAVPGDERMTWGKGMFDEGRPGWPKDSVLVRTLSLQTRPGDSSSTRKIETQLLHFNGRRWNGYTYAWNDEQSDADLVDAGGDTKVIDIQDSSVPGSIRKQSWHYAGRNQCMVCHNPWSNFALAFNDEQLDRDQKFGDATENGLAAFRRLGLLLEPKPRKPDDEALSSEKRALTNPYDDKADLNERARSYLHVNCSHCHRYGGGGSALFDVRKELALDKMKLVNEKPNLGGFDIDDARIVFSGDPSRSVLYYRTSKLGTGRMPHIGSDVVDDRGVALLRQWIFALPSRVPSPRPTEETARHRTEQDNAIQSLRVPGIPTDQATLSIDKLVASTSGALALLSEIESGTLPQPVAQLAATRAAASQQGQVRDLFRRFDPAQQAIARLGNSINPAKLLALKGDASRGQKVFFELNGTGMCQRCHITNGRGTAFGPDLSHIAAKYDKAQLLDNILNPSKTILQGFETYVVKRKSGDVVTGFLVAKTDREVVIKDAQLQQIHIPTADVAKMVTQPISAMPEGLLADLEAQQAADLVEFLSTLK